jgi:hypothetical protein
VAQNEIEKTKRIRKDNGARNGLQGKRANTQAYEHLESTTPVHQPEDRSSWQDTALYDGQKAHELNTVQEPKTISPTPHTALRIDGIIGSSSGYIFNRNKYRTNTLKEARF